jgi:hypothetical protein
MAGTQQRPVPQTDFVIDFTTAELTCPNQIVIDFEVGKTVHFPKQVCAAGPPRTQCTTSSTGRTISIHPDQALLVELRERQKPLPGEPNSTNPPRSNTPPLTSDTGKENVPATETPARTSPTYPESPSSTTSTSSPDNPPQRLLDRRSLDADGQVRQGADVAELTGLLELPGWPAGMRVIVRRERPHPGAQLSLFEEPTAGATPHSSPTPPPASCSG